MMLLFSALTDLRSMVYEGLEPKEEMLEDESNHNDHWSISEDQADVLGTRYPSHDNLIPGNVTKGNVHPILALFAERKHRIREHPKQRIPTKQKPLSIKKAKKIHGYPRNVVKMAKKSPTPINQPDRKH